MACVSRGLLLAQGVSRYREVAACSRGYDEAYALWLTEVVTTLAVCDASRQLRHAEDGLPWFLLNRQRSQRRHLERLVAIRDRTGEILQIDLSDSPPETHQKQLAELDQRVAEARRELARRQCATFYHRQPAPRLLPVTTGVAPTPSRWHNSIGTVRPTQTVRLPAAVVADRTHL